MGMAGVAADQVPASPVRVVIVDDTDDLRFMLRLQFRRDERFEVVGEGADGNEAIALAAELRPDLMILDRQMPNLGGLEAMPEIRRVSPTTAIVLYTANADPGTYQAAVDAGALEVLQKAGTGGAVIDRLVGSLAERVGSGATMEVRVGPVPSSAARVWVANTIAILDAIEAHPEVLGGEVPPDVWTTFRSFLDQWAALAATTEEFEWVAKARPQDARRIIEHWAAIDAMTDEQLAALGMEWSPPEGQPFFQALTTGVLEGLRRHEEHERLASRLLDQWAPFRTDGT